MTALKDLLADPEQPIAFVAELTYRDPDTDVVSTIGIWDGKKRRSEVPAGDLWGLLINPGGRTVSVEGDELSGIGESSAEPMTFSNDPDAPGAAGPLDFLRTKTLARRAVTLLAGAPDEAVSNYEEVGSGVADREPEFDDTGNLMTLRLKTALGRLDQDLDVKSYVGEPGALKLLTTTGRAAAADDANHHLVEFALAGRFRIAAATVNAQRFMYRETSSTAQNWRVFMLSTGLLRGITSSGGVGSQNLLSSTDAYDDDSEHWWAYVVGAIHAYLMVDGEVVAETASPAVPDTPTAGVAMGLNFPGAWLSDSRIYNHYITPDEMRTAMATRADGDEEGLVALWRGDDAIGGTLTDYSPTGADAAITGVENTDYEWVSSDLGEAEIAGQSMLATIASVWNAKADLVSALFERWRVNDRDFSTTPQKTVRDEGEELSSPADYDWSGAAPVIALTSEAGEPVTVGTDLLGAGLGSELLTEVLLTRGPLESSELDLSPWISLTTLAAGLQTRRRPVREIVEEVMRGTMGYLTQAVDGTLRADVLVTPTAPSPRGGSCLEIVNGPTTLQDGGIEWASPAGSLTSRNFTLALWIKTLRLGPAFGSTSKVNLIDIAGSTAALDGTMFYMNISSTSPVFTLDRLGGGGIAATASATSTEILTPGWYFVAVVHDHAANQTRFYVGLQGGTLSLIGTVSGLSYSAAPPDRGVQVGGVALQASHVFRGSVFEPSMWDEARSLAQLQSQMDDGLAGNEANLAFYAPLDGSATASLTDTVGSVTATLTADHVAERPNLIVDLTKVPRPLNRRKLVPAWRIESRYRRNYAILGPEQISALVPDGSASPGAENERLQLQKEWRSEDWESPAVAEDYLDAREIVLDTPWLDNSGGLSTLRLARHRYAPGREAAILGPTPGAPLREGLLLEVGDEVRVYGHQDLADGPVYRVVSNKALYDDLDCRLGLWR